MASFVAPAYNELVIAGQNTGDFNLCKVGEGMYAPWCNRGAEAVNQFICFNQVDQPNLNGTYVSCAVVQGNLRHGTDEVVA